MDDFTMGQQSFLFPPSSDGGEYQECGLLFPQSDESGCPKSMQIDCRAVNTQQVPQEARGKAHVLMKEHKCRLLSHRTATTQKIQTVKRGV